MGVLLKMTIRETYASVGTIAGSARLPVGTVKNHLLTLDQNGWIVNEGRQKTRRGFLRRTATLKITKQTIDATQPYGILPWWACCKIGNKKQFRLPWCAKAVLSILMGRLCSLKGAAERDGPDDDLEGQIDNMGGDDRFRFGLSYLAGQTGLTRDSVVTAKQTLAKVGIVKWMGNRPKPGQDTNTHLLVPNYDFAVVVTPASAGRCFLDFERGSKSGR
jgi:hypothetical protein